MLRFLVKTAVACCILACGGFLVFHARQVSYSDAAAQARAQSVRHSDTIVLTGGPGRITAGLTLLRDDRTDHVFVSGVARTYRKRLLPPLDGLESDMLECCVTLGFKALDTAGNGEESAAWLKERGSSGVFLVTARYHMPRALVELRRWSPGTIITPISVNQDSQTKRQIKEFLKYGAALVRLRTQDQASNALPAKDSIEAKAT